MSEFGAGIIAAIVVGGAVGMVLIVVLAVYIPRLQHQKELKRQHQQQYALKLQRRMKPLRYPNMSKLSSATPSSITPSPTDSPTSRRSTSFDELDYMEKYMEGDESGEMASQVHEAFRAIKQVNEGNVNDDNDNQGSHVTVVSMTYDDVIQPIPYDPLHRTGHMKMSSLSAPNSKGNNTTTTPSAINIKNLLVTNDFANILQS